jgi:hypothetical protein
MQRRGYLLCAFLIAVLLNGCSGSSGSPSLPSPLERNRRHTVAQDSSRFVWGLWEIGIDAAGTTVEIVPLRGPQMTVDVVKFLQPPSPAGNCISVSVKDISEFKSEGRIVLDVGLKHPFPGYDQFTGFDVYGVFVHRGGLEFAHGSDMIEVSDGVQSAILENADGYTIWMSPELFPADGTVFTFQPGMFGTPDFPGDEAADANGFKYFADGLASDENVAGFFMDEANFRWRGKFSPGSINTREYVLRFPVVGGSPVVKFQYAVTANWHPADKGLSGDPDVLDVPADFPLEANAREPIFLSVTDKSTTWYVDDENFGGDILLDLEIFTWHGLDGIGPIHLSSAGDLIPGGTAVFDPDSLSWSPGTFNSSVTPVEIDDATPSSVAGQEILIAVEAAPPLTYDQGFGHPAPDLPLAAYRRHTLAVANTEPAGDLVPMAVAMIEPYFDGFGPLGTVDDPVPTEWYLTLNASSSTGPIVEYWWEMNGDDLFDDASGAIVSAGFPDVGTHVIKLKITDGHGGEAVYQLPGTYEVVLGTYVWLAYPGDYSDGTRGAPWITIPEGLSAAGEDGYILVRGDDGLGGQCVYTDDLILGSGNSGVRIQGYYGDYETDEPPMQTGYVRIEGSDITFDGFEVTGPSYSTYMPYGHRSKLGMDQAANALFRHLYIHDLNADCKAILAWFGGKLTVQNCLEVELDGMYQKNQAHEDLTDPAPELVIINCTFDRLGSTEKDDVGLYISSGGGANPTPTVTNSIWTDIADGASTIYLRRQGPMHLFVDYNCTFDTVTPPDGGIYYQGVDLGDHVYQFDPEYVDPFGDHHLQPDSGAIDAGDPTILDPDGTISDLGCYGGPYGAWDFEN